MLTSAEIQSLGQAINSTWGSASTPRGDFPVGSAPQFSIKAKLVALTDVEFDNDQEPKDDARLVVNYVTVVSFRSREDVEAERRRFADEAHKLIKSYVGELKSEFKSSAGRALKLKQLDTEDNIEVFHTGNSLSVYSQRYRPDIHRAYYRYAVTFQVN